MTFALPWHGRRLVVVAAVTVMAMLAGGLTAAQIRAAQADERRDSLAAQQATDRDLAQRSAEQEAARVERVQLVLSWARAAEQADAAVAAADVALFISAGSVADDAIRLALAVALEELRATVADPPADPSDDDVAALAALTSQVLAATTAVTEAQTAWPAQQDAAGAAAAAAAAPSPESLRWPNAGAVPDCGGANAYEPSDGGTVFHTSTPTVEGDGTNGNVPRSAMTALSWCTDSAGNQQWLRTDAAEAMVRLNAAFSAEFGENIAIDLSYRSYADQVAIRDALGSIAAVPGTSKHGLGLAIDTWEWAAYSFGTPRYEWLVANGPTYGWVTPSASSGGSNSEYWHFEYVG